jgi:DNA-directed RNA polymerase specialized sigma24 family protein
MIEKQAFEQIFRRHYDGMFRLARRMLGSDALHHYIDTELPPLSQQILRLRYQQGLKYREIAETLKVSEVTVHNHLSQSLKQMKEHFKAKGYDI